MTFSTERLHRHAGIAVFLCSLGLYLKTMAPTVSFWDTGEFIASSYILGVPHPPGAPLYVLIGRVFSMLPFGEVAWRIVLMSVLSSALAIWCAYLTAAALARRALGGHALRSFGDSRDVSVAIGSVVASLSLAVSYTMWFNATEAEVYGYSILFAALGVWLIVYWDGTQHGASNDRWLFLLAYLFGLGGGIHMLCLLTIPSLLILAWFADEKLRRLVFVIVGAGLWGLFYLTIFADYPESAKLIALLAAAAAIVLHAYVWMSHPGLRPTVIGLAATGAAVVLAAAASDVETPAGFAMLVGGAGLAWHLYRTDRRALAILVGCALLFALGYSTYLALFIRSGLNPAIDENDPETWAAFLGFLNREQYGTDSMLLSMLEPRASRVYQLWHQQMKYFLQQFPFPLLSGDVKFRWATQDVVHVISVSIIPYALGVGGLIWHGVRDWRRFAAIAVVFIVMGLGLSLYLNMQDPQPRERHYVFGGMFYAFALWMGLGWTGLVELVRTRLALRRHAVVGLACLGLLIPLGIGAKLYHIEDRTGDHIAYDYAYNLLQTCEPNSILFTNGDNDTFPLWFLQEVEGIRTDIRVVNLSLLNTNWYIKQLRDREPKIDLKLRDSYIDSTLTDTQSVDLAKRMWREPLKSQIAGEMKRLGLDVELSPPPEYAAMRVQDFMIIAILKWNAWKRPIYFALTVGPENKIGLQPHLRLMGMTSKLVPETGIPNSREALRTNLYEVYRYRGVSDESVFKDPNATRLLGNYRACVLTLADIYREEGRVTEVEELFEWADDTLLRSWEFLYSAGEFYREMGQLPEGAELLERAGDELMKAYGNQSTATYYNAMGIANVLFDAYGESERAERLYRKVMAREPVKYEAYRELAAALQQNGDVAGALAVVREFQKHDASNDAAVDDEQILLNAMRKSEDD